MDSETSIPAAMPPPAPPPSVASGGTEARRGVLLVFGAALVWSFGGAIARGLDVSDPWTIIAWRSFFAAVFLLGFMLWRDGPAGTVRLTTFHWIASTLLARRLPDFLARHPGITVEVSVDDGLHDIVALGFDAGIRLGESVERDMIAVRIGPALRTVVVATPGYWDAHGRPGHPRDLLGHACINYRNGAGTLMPWEFEQGGRTLRLQVRGPLVCNASGLALAAVRAGCGVGWAMEEDVTEDLAAGRLEQSLDSWSQPYPGAFLYHPSRRQVPPPLRTLIDHFRM